MTALRKLRRHGTWQVLLAQGIVDVVDAELWGVLLIVDRKSGAVRLVRPLVSPDELSDALLDAARDPQGGEKPARPRSLECVADLAPLLRRVAPDLGTTVVVRQALPEAERVMDHLAASLDGGAALLPATDLPWDALMADALAAAPWAAVPDAVGFGLDSDDPLLDGAVVVVLGQAGEQLGFTLFPDVRAWQLFQIVADMGPGALDIFPIAFTCAHFSEPDEVDGFMVHAAAEAGLVQQGLVLELYTLTSGGQGLRGLAPSEELAMYRAVRAVLAAWTQHGAELGDQPTTTHTTDDGVSTVVHSFPPGVEPPAPSGVFDGPAQLRGVLADGLMGDETPALLFKYAKPDAVRIAERIRGIDAVELFPQEDGHVRFEGWSGDEWLGELTTLPPADELDALVRGPSHCRVIISAGGARRRSMRSKDFQLDTTVALIVSSGPGRGDDPGPLFRPRRPPPA